MSMLSSQCDTLRVAADALEDEGVMPACAKLMRDAAETIWQLRNDCVELRDEKENLTRLLREALEKKFSDEDDLRAENAKLRELVVQAHECKTNDGCCEDCYQDEGCCPIERDMEELGIEVERWIS